MAESVQIASINFRHEQMADWLIAHPTCKNLQELADHMGFSRSWISIVMQSDVWKEYWTKRRSEYVSGMNDKIQRVQLEVTLKAWEKLPFIIEDEETDPRLVFDIANKTAERLFGAANPKTTVIEERTQELSSPVSADVLATARETLRRTVRTEYNVLPAPEST